MQGKIIQAETIEPPFPWATNRRAVVHSLRNLQTRGIAVVVGEMECRKCQARVKVTYDIRAKLRAVAEVMRRQSQMRERAPLEWMQPALMSCRECGDSGGKMVPVMPQKRRKIDWLFMFLGQTVGCCTIKHLKYFCKHNKIHRTGAKNRLVYYTYTAIYKQLNPAGDREFT